MLAPSIKLQIQFIEQGELIGIISHIKSQSGGNEGLGFAVSINTAKKQILEKPAFWSGLEIVPVQGRLARALNVPVGAGLIVQNVANNYIASRLGLRAGTVPITYGDKNLVIGGDIIVRVGDQNVYLSEKGFIALLKKIEIYKTQESFKVTVIREGKEIELSTKLRDGNIGH